MKKTYKVPLTALCTITGWMTVKATNGKDAVAIATVSANTGGVVERVEPDWDNLRRWEFPDDWDSVTEMEEE